MVPLHKLLLWDIDGTLTSSTNAGRKALSRAFQQRHQIETSLSEIDLRGNTDQNLTRELFTHHQIPHTEENFSGFHETYLKFLAEELEMISVTIFPGVREILEAVHRRGDIAQGLLTGNLQRGAQLKLEAVGIWQYFDFGAFGDDALFRNDLGAIALKRATEKLHTEFELHNVFVIGDTVRDIECARAMGANSIAVTTGGHSAEELGDEEPTAVLTDLRDITGFFSIIDHQEE